MPLHVEVLKTYSFTDWIQNCMMISKFITSIKNKSCLFVGRIRESNNSSAVSEYNINSSDGKAFNFFRSL